MTDAIPPLEANRIYTILCEELGVSDSGTARSDFVDAQGQEDGCREYRLCYASGLKFRNTTDGWHVTCYREEETPERKACVQRANERLLAAKTLYDFSAISKARGA